MDNALVKGLAYYDWLSCYCELGTKFSRYAPNKNTWNWGKWNALQNTLGETYIVSRDKSLLNLPDAIDMPLITLDMSPEQRACYETFSNITLEYIKKKSAESGNGIMHELTNSFQILQMAVDNPESIINSPVMESIKKLEVNPQFIKAFEDALQKFSYKNHYAKLNALDNILEYETKEMENKVLVFYYHPKTLEYLKERYPEATVLSSDIDENERFKIVEDFRKNDKCKILIASIMIANTSFTLTECKAAIFYERYWSGIIYEQARGRIHRIGQDKTCFYYYLLVKNSIETWNLELLKTGKELTDDLFKEEK
jgi:SNF2 family DNA or RNA helicase